MSKVEIKTSLVESEFAASWRMSFHKIHRVSLSVSASTHPAMAEGHLTPTEQKKDHR